MALVIEPIPISLVAGRYLLFDVNVVTYLRKTYNICGVLIGGIPQIPQQNVFLGLPVELLSEEVKLLVEKGVAYVVDAAARHKENFSTLEASDRKLYLESLRSRGRMAQKAAEENMQRKTVLGLEKQALLKAKKPTPPSSTISSHVTGLDNTAFASKEDPETIFSGNSRSKLLPKSSKLSTSASLPYTITPTSTYGSLSGACDLLPQTDPPVPVSYPLFAHLHSHSYYVTPGLRFGCDYTVYPGDPLRFHSHFLAVGYDWDEDIALMDLIGGGRLGTGVKKGFLIGGRKKLPELTGDGLDVRTFCIEWGGM
jgi:tRNA-splicing endonuclease subunit Sen34